MKTFLSVFMLACISLAQDVQINPSDKPEMPGTLIKKELKWFYQKEFKSLEVRVFNQAADSKPEKIVTIQDGKTIEQLKSKIEKLPAKGDEFVSWAPDVSFIELVFKSENGEDKVEIYGKKIKTPSTAFSSDKKTDQMTKDILATVEKLISKKN